MVAAKGNGVSLFDTLYGAVKFFTEEHIQWDVVDASMDWSDLRTLVVATAPATEAALDKLEAFVAAGGSLLVDPNAVLTTQPFAARWHSLLGIQDAKPSAHPGSYYSVSGHLAKGLPDMAHYVHAPGLELKPATGSKVLARLKTPPFVRSREHFYGHFHVPDILDAGAAVISSQVGRVIAFAQPLLAAYLHTGYHAHRTLLRNVFQKPTRRANSKSLSAHRRNGTCRMINR